jgi:hypothetical protein
MKSVSAASNASGCSRNAACPPLNSFTVWLGAVSAARFDRL